MRQSRKLKAGLGGLAALVGAGFFPAQAQQLTDQSFQTNIVIDVLPIAELSFPGSTTLFLDIPPGDSTDPSDGVEFLVTGNADATLIAEPDEFVLIDSQYMGKAVKAADAVGYKLTLYFPDQGTPPPGDPTNTQSATLPGFQPGPTQPPLTVDLSSTGQERTGVLHMQASPDWTPGGGIPAPGLYVGEVLLTVTASD